MPSPARAPRDYTPKHLAEKILQSKSALEGERKQVTVLFADVKGSMELAEQLDPETWHAILDRFFQLLTDGVHRFEGTVNQYTGDGIMALFGAPIAHEDHAQRACYAALHLRDAVREYANEVRVRHGIPFGVRIGLNSGEVVVGRIGDDLRMDYTAQRAPELFQVLRPLADRPRTPARFLILGSASPDLIRGTSESLAGRVGFVDLGGFDLTEVGTGHMRRLWVRGGFPRSYLAKTETLSMRWRRDFVRTLLERDVPQLGIRIPPEALRRFWMMLAHYHGQIWNGAELARSLGVNEHGVRRYLDVLSGTYLVRQLPPWFENLSKRQYRAPRVYVRDSGLLHALLGVDSWEGLTGHPKLGASWEGFALEHALATVQGADAYFWGTHAGAELDFAAAAGWPALRRRVQVRGRPSHDEVTPHRAGRPQARARLDRVPRQRKLSDPRTGRGGTARGSCGPIPFDRWAPTYKTRGRNVAE